MIMRFRDVPIICFWDVAIIHFREVPIIRFPDVLSSSLCLSLWLPSLYVKVRRFLWLNPILLLLVSIEPKISFVHRISNRLKFLYSAVDRISVFRNVMSHPLTCLIFDIPYITPNNNNNNKCQVNTETILTLAVLCVPEGSSTSGDARESQPTGCSRCGGDNEVQPVGHVQRRLRKLRFSAVTTRLRNEFQSTGETTVRLSQQRDVFLMC